MRVELLTIGDELLLGFVVDTNAVHLARELATVGVEIVRRTTVPDDIAVIAGAVREAIERTGAVITSGGLGPTSDDLTVPAIAKAFGRELRLDEAVLADIERKFRGFGLQGPMPAGNRQQAMIPEGARVLQNAHGTAPGVWLEDERGRWVATLPGVPREMRGLVADHLLPTLRARAGAAPTVVRSRTLRTTGIGESALAELLGEDGRAVDGMPVAYNPKWAGTDVRLTSRGRAAADADRALDAAAARLRARAERYIYAEGETDLAAVVLDLLRARRLTIAVGESCTGGLLGARLTAIPGASDAVRGGVVAYDDAVKTALLGVGVETLRADGAVSEAVALEMASGARAAAGSDVGVGITGIAGPDGGTPDKPVGTVWVAVDFQGARRAFGRVYVGDREEIRLRATQAALDLVRRAARDGA
jgi:nicotinamide-nucleotide amidase